MERFFFYAIKVWMVVVWVMMIILLPLWLVVVLVNAIANIFKTGRS